VFEDISPSLEFIEEFIDHSFWDELIVRFAERDAARQPGGYEKLDLLSHEDRHALVDPFEGGMPRSSMNEASTGWKSPNGSLATHRSPLQRMTDFTCLPSISRRFSDRFP
jgi:hypothetical protein